MFYVIRRISRKSKRISWTSNRRQKTEVEGKVEATGANLKNKAHDAMEKAEAKKEDVEAKAEATSTDLKHEAAEAVESVTHAAEEVKDVVKGAVDGVKNILDKK